MPDARDFHNQPDFQKQIVRLEEMLCHEQHRVDLLNQVVIELRTEIDVLRRKLARLEQHCGSLDQRLRENEDNLPLEKPPHY